MKTKFIYYLSILCLFVFFAGCSDDEDTAEVYFPEAQKTISNVFSITEEPYVLKYTVTLAGTDFATVKTTAENDITIYFEVDMSLVNTYNQECGTSLLPMPEGSYSIPASAVIPKGSSSTDSLPVLIDAMDKFESFTPYLLPVRISKVDGAGPYQYQQILYIALSGVADAEHIELYDRTSWTIADFSTEEPGEGGGNGLAQCAIDDNPDTYWHSKWAGGEPEPPHYITIDMGEAKVLHGIALMNRYFEGSWATDGHGQPKNIKIHISSDGEVWKDNGGFSNLPHPEGQPFTKFFFNNYNEARYIKVTVTEVYATNSTSVAEFGAF